MNRSAFIVGSAVLVVGILAGDMVLRHVGPGPKEVVARKEPGPVTPAEARVEVAPASRVEAPAVEERPAVESAPPVVTEEGVPVVARATATTPTVRVHGRRSPDVNPDASPPVVPVEVARAALAYVGADPEAEEVWATAINDPSLSAHARQDLIEDLNEDGFADPKNVTVDELPLVVSRLELIEEMAPDAMDQVNTDAFAEAYKDLANMYVRLTNQ